ncbi:MAG: hypothetical protein EA397_02985 [Deltaproteobacteria bacterium]|nr:MAG: hypothetical protein EA397_02985 [Deltaproteobacteria bacterium]
MSTPFLLHYAASLVQALLDEDLIEIRAGQEEVVVRYLAKELQLRGEGRSLISCTSQALLRCDQVEELFADDDEIKELVQDIGRR